MARRSPEVQVGVRDLRLAEVSPNAGAGEAHRSPALVKARRDVIAMAKDGEKKRADKAGEKPLKVRIYESAADNFLLTLKITKKTINLQTGTEQAGEHKKCQFRSGFYVTTAAEEIAYLDEYIVKRPALAWDAEEMLAKDRQVAIQAAIKAVRDAGPEAEEAVLQALTSVDGDEFVPAK